MVSEHAVHISVPGTGFAAVSTVLICADKATTVFKAAHRLPAAW